MKLSVKLVLLSVFLMPLWANPAAAQVDEDSLYVRQHYTKIERHVPMRDGARLFTSIYVPKDSSQTYPILMQRTPYSVAPYGEDAYKQQLGPSMALARDGYIFVYQDVRGKMMSEGDFEAVRPHDPNKSSNEDIDESSDTYDTVEWLLDSLATDNGRVGVWGISAPGFYATHALIDAHPAIEAVSPQAPVTDWFIGDDRHHNGAFQLQASFSFLSSYGEPRPEPTTERPSGFRDYGTPDGYEWYLNLGPVKNANERYFHGENEIWNAMMEHGTYDDFWQARTPLPHLRDVRPAVLVVGGFYDAQDLYGPLKTYETIEEQNPGTPSYFVMGPWWHGQWARSMGDRYGPFYFEQNTSEFYRQNIERPFFNYYLKDGGSLGLPEASIFITGSDAWHFFDAWPPPDADDRSLYLQPNGGLAFDPPAASEEVTGGAEPTGGQQSGGSGYASSTEPTFAEYLSDPDNPVPHTPDIVINRDDAYVVRDQRFAATRPDVLVFESEPLEEDVTMAGRLFANLFVSTTGTDADYIVKLIDVYPGDAECELPNAPCAVPMGGFQALVRGEVMRAKFRNSFVHPEPMNPGEITEVTFDMQDVGHTFRKGHKIMVQIQSTWFPMVDRNPQQFLDIYNADEEDFQSATHRVYFSREHPSHLKVQVLE